jgi:molybdopterin/thiamine biosynthesis adenylyltransferase
LVRSEGAEDGLSDVEVERYSRQLLLPEMGEAAQLRLRRATVAVVGCGALGSAAAPYLVGAGVGRVLLLDPDIVALDNLHRQVQFSTADIGASKSRRLAERLRALNELVVVEPFPFRADPSSLSVTLDGAELILECTDDPETKFALNDWAVGTGRPLVIAGVTGLRGQVLQVDASGPCYRCLFRATPAAAADCRTAGILGPVAGVVGAMQALLALTWLAGISSANLAGRLWDLDAGAMRWREIHFPRDPNCPSHRR